MKVTLKGKFYEAGSYYSESKKENVPYIELIVGKEIVQIQNAAVKPGTPQMAEIVIDCNIYARASRFGGAPELSVSAIVDRKQRSAS